MVGKEQCVVEATADTVITCIVPQRDEPVIESVTVSNHAHTYITEQFLITVLPWNKYVIFPSVSHFQHKLLPQMCHGS